MPKASVIVVNYNGEDSIPGLFRSLTSQTFRDYEVVFVDNASTDKSLTLAWQYANALRMRIIENNENLGFCLANNVAAESCDGNYIVFLNNDAFVDSNWLAMLVARAEGSRNAGAVVGSTLPPNSRVVEGGPASFDIFGAAFGYVGKRFFYGTGSSFLVRNDVFRRIGAFDVKLFMYLDDVDLCWRMRLFGYEIVHESRAISYHLKESKGIMRDNMEMPLWKFFHSHCKNRIRVLMKNYSRVNVIRRVPIALFLIFSRSLLLSILNGEPQYALCFFKGITWNLRNLSDTIKERYKVQRLRKNADCEVDNYMLRYPVEALFLRTLHELCCSKMRGLAAYAWVLLRRPLSRNCARVFHVLV